MAELMPSDEDLLYEEEILRNPFSLRMWLRYIEARKDAPDKRRFLLFERAISKLPGSYKVRCLQETMCLMLLVSIQHYYFVVHTKFAGDCVTLATSRI